MNNGKIHTAGDIAVRLWLSTSLYLVVGGIVYVIFTSSGNDLTYILIASVPAFACSLVGSLPALIVLWFCLITICKRSSSPERKWLLLILSQLFITLFYTLPIVVLKGFFSNPDNEIAGALQNGGLVTGVLFLATVFAAVMNQTAVQQLFSANDTQLTHLIHSNTTDMQHEQSSSETGSQSAFQSSSPWDSKPVNKTIIKLGITGALILLMLIPVSYIESLITERAERQEQIVKEVSSRWAASQTVTPLYLVIPYKTGDSVGKKEITENLVILPEQVSVKGNVEPEKRHRSAYDVLLYRSQLSINGEFRFSLPQNIPADKLLLTEAKLCTGISDFKGIEKKVTVRFGENDVLLSPGLPVDIDSSGLSAPVSISAAQLTAAIPFSFSLALKGSSSLHFKPMSANSSFDLASSWPHPSFDGNVIPVKDNGREENGFPAKWSFSNANLPFATVLLGGAIKSYNDLSFGVSLIQPVDQYAKSMRSIKYAILVIGLTFALFFIIEIVQKNPVHPIQYILVGLALVIFYSLLVSISEFIPFDFAYLIAATATVVLITLYTRSHFRNWKTAGIFFSILSGLYGFIYTLISLEDTALLTGSIALFVVLAIAMYTTRKINWYQPLGTKSEATFSSSI